MKVVEKDPAAVMDYSLDWSYSLEGDTIATDAWTVPAASGLTVDSHSHTTTVATAWLSGGTLSRSPYRVTCTITTAGGRTDKRSIWVQVTSR